ncbi:unnamed protein product [Penicillium salamii]|uniref:J domain-containing protein n=1 Tax=Penicillium salamii TaxID=1612424 RepID=A0A9W4JZ61_9EURO|nr:unnamed protein product [Penicillium salamii]
MPRVPAIRLAPTPTHRVVIVTAPLRPRPHTQAQPRLHQPIFPKRTFTSTRPTLAREQNFYEILDLPTSASAAEIKKQFYALSMRHHPDRNRTDPNAGQRFARISAAYNVLGNASKRAVYDRDHGFHQVHASAAPGHSHAHPMGSHSSYAGSRPASGLSKRRSAFHGPPPSFYEQGGYGGTGRRGDGFAAGKAGPSKFASAGPEGARTADPEDWEGFIRRNPLNHFNARGHFRTQAAEDRRRRDRARAWRAASVSDAEWSEPPEYGAVHGVSFTRFLFSLGCLVVAGASAGLWPSGRDDGGKRKG